MSNANKETVLFVLRQAVLFALPLALQAVAGKHGAWWALAGALLAAFDKWVHENDNVNANGLLPF